MKSVIIYLTLLISAFYAGSADTPSDYGGEETEYIDGDTAAKLAMVASYHAVYGRAYSKTMRLYSLTDRIVIDNRVITSLDGEREYYAVSLYRGEDDPKTLEQFNGGITAWADYMVGCIEKTGDNTYELEPVINIREPYSYEAWFDLYESVGEFRDYYSCVVPASTSQGFLLEFFPGISPYLLLSELAVRILAEDTGVDRSEVELIRSSPGHNFLLKVSGDLYVVSIVSDFSAIFLEVARRTRSVDIFYEMSGKEFKSVVGDALAPVTIEITRPEDVDDIIENGDETGLSEENNNEDINDWLGYLAVIEKKSGFGQGPSVTAKLVNAVLLGRKVPTLFAKGSANRGGSIKKERD